MENQNRREDDKPFIIEGYGFLALYLMAIFAGIGFAAVAKLLF